MQSFLSLLALSLIALTMSAAPIDCQPGTLQDYINLGPTGCALSDKVVAGFTELEIPNSATLISADTILVIPVATPFMPSLVFSTPATAGAGTLLYSRFGYSVTAANPITSLGLDLAGASVTGDGSVTIIKQSCLTADNPDAALCASPPTDPLLLFAISGDSSLSATSPLSSPASFLLIAEDIGLDGGADGTAGFTTATNTFFETATVPEPTTWTTAALGLLLLTRLRRR